MDRWHHAILKHSHTEFTTHINASVAHEVEMQSKSITFSALCFQGANLPLNNVRLDNKNCPLYVSVSK